SSSHSGSSFLAEMKRIVSSDRPGGVVSCSMSVTKPYLYSRLTSCSMELVILPPRETREVRRETGSSRAQAAKRPEAGEPPFGAQQIPPLAPAALGRDDKYTSRVSRLTSHDMCTCPTSRRDPAATRHVGLQHFAEHPLFRGAHLGKALGHQSMRTMPTHQL